MSLFTSNLVKFDELAQALHCLPEDATGLSRDATLELWQRWHLQGSVQWGRVDAMLPSGSSQPMALGITVWLTDAAVAALTQPSPLPRPLRIYEAAARGQPWIMALPEIVHAHDRNALHLVVLHFWSRLDMSDPAFQSVFLQSHAMFRDLHQGFGVQTLLQEVSLQQQPFLEAAGMRVVDGSAGPASFGQAWMGMSRPQAISNPGSTFSFLFFSPPRRLLLKPAVQRMLTHALRQMTDEHIAQAMGCSREYVRKLWSDAYGCMETAGALAAASSQPVEGQGPVRGRERRRTALEFLRANPHELRPGLQSPT